MCLPSSAPSAWCTCHLVPNSSTSNHWFGVVGLVITSSPSSSVIASHTSGINKQIDKMCTRKFCINDKHESLLTRCLRVIASFSPAWRDYLQNGRYFSSPNVDQLLQATHETLLVPFARSFWTKKDVLWSSPPSIAHAVHAVDIF